MLVRSSSDLHLKQIPGTVFFRLLPVKSASARKALQDLHVRPRTASAGTYHHPCVSYFGALPSPCLPAPDVGFEFEVFTLEVLLRGCSHDVHVRYLFDPLLSQGMEIETLCPKRAVWY